MHDVRRTFAPKGWWRACRPCPRARSWLARTQGAAPRRRASRRRPPSCTFRSSLPPKARRGPRSARVPATKPGPRRARGPQGGAEGRGHSIPGRGRKSSQAPPSVGCKPIKRGVRSCDMHQASRTEFLPHDWASTRRKFRSAWHIATSSAVCVDGSTTSTPPRRSGASARA